MGSPYMERVSNRVVNAGPATALAFSLFGLATTLALVTWVGVRYGLPWIGLIWTSSILLHEVGHYLVYRFYGYPAVILIYPFFGGATGPYTPEMQREFSRAQEVMLYFAGPLATGILLGGGLAHHFLTGSQMGLTIAGVNGMLGAFNMLYMKSTDAAFIVRSFYDRTSAQQRQAIARVLSALAWVTLLTTVLASRDIPSSLLAVTWIFSLSQARRPQPTHRWLEPPLRYGYFVAWGYGLLTSVMILSAGLAL